MEYPRIAVLITCHNRKSTTLSCLTHFNNQVNVPKCTSQVYLVDDGSTDGTSKAVHKEFPEVRILQGDGALYWCGGMRLAWEEAAKEDYDYYLWLNDDTALFPNAIQLLLETNEYALKKDGCDCVVVGAICDPVTGQVTYGGDDENGKKIVPHGHPQQCDLINGNVVLVPRGVFLNVGNFDPIFTHWFGDSDYAVRVSKAGYHCWLTNSYVGSCESNPAGTDWANPSIGLGERIRILHGPKGLPFKQWRVYARRRYGYSWPVSVFKIYARLLFPRLWSTIKSNAS